MRRDRKVSDLNQLNALLRIPCTEHTFQCFGRTAKITSIVVLGIRVDKNKAIYGVAYPHFPAVSVCVCSKHFGNRHVYHQ